MKFNVNDKVRVRLTEAGRTALRNNHERLYAGFTNKPKFRSIEEEREVDGWSTWQLWHLMQEFGPHMRNGGQALFETTIEIIEPANTAS